MAHTVLAALCLWLTFSIGEVQAQAGGPIRIQDAIESDTLGLLTLNIAHGRGTSLNQLLVSREGHQHNLADIASLLLATDVDIAALQEADGPSLWSGSFDHVQQLAQLTGFQSVVHGRHAESWLFSYGAALLSRVRMLDTVSHSFAPSWPTATKGYVRGSVRWQRSNRGLSPQTVTIVSVHLDFSRKSVRAAQTAELLAELASLPRPLIVMGDFNASWGEVDSPVRELAEQAGLRSYRPSAQDLSTYKESERLDWILISEGLTFKEYSVVPDIVSDHLAVVARIGLNRQ